MKKNLLLTGVLMILTWSYSQQLVWTGNANNNNFFDENIWQNTNTNLSPSSGTIDANQAINIDLHNAITHLTASGIINLGAGSLSILSSNLQTFAFSSGNVSLSNNAYIDLSATNSFQNNVNIDFKSGISWIKTLNKKGVDINNDNLGQILVNGVPSVYQSNLCLDHYYLDDTVIISNDLSISPLMLYDNLKLQGTSTSLSLDIIHSSTAIPNNMNNKAESFLLKKGYMINLPKIENGTGKSKNYIDSEEDLVINGLPTYLLNDVSFIRVLPWNWVNKKGRTGPDTKLNNTWNCQWNNTGSSIIEPEYAPMAWSFFGANDDGVITLYKSKYKGTYVMAFNEADNCNDQSGEYNNLCNTDVAVTTYKNLIKTELTLVSPSYRENTPFGWLKEFHDKAIIQDIRIGVISVHSYDWGSSPKNTPNANTNGTTATNYGFMQLAMPYLETLDYVESYAWYQPNSDLADYYTDYSNTTLTHVGVFYKNQVSTQSVPEPTVFADSNLDFYNTLDINYVNESTIINLVLFPNLTKGLFTLKTSLDIKSYYIYNVQGQLIKSNQKFTSTETKINLQMNLMAII